MVNRFSVLVLFIGLIGCNSSKSKKTIDDSLKKAQLQSDSMTEYIGVVKVNGVINFRDSFKNVRSKLGAFETGGMQISDQKDPNGNFSRNKLYSNVNFKGISFHESNYTLTLAGIDFVKSPAAYLQTEKISLSSKTTFNDVKKVFPKSADNELSGTDMDKILAIAIPADKSAPDNMWLLYFDRNTEKLLRINYVVSD